MRWREGPDTVVETTSECDLMMAALKIVAHDGFVHIQKNLLSFPCRGLPRRSMYRPVVGAGRSPWTSDSKWTKVSGQVKFPLLPPGT